MKAIISVYGYTKKKEHKGNKIEIKYRDDGSLTVRSYSASNSNPVTLAEYSAGSWQYARLFNENAQ